MAAADDQFPTPSPVPQSLEDEAHRLRAIHDAVVNGIITADGRGVIRSVNPAVLRLFGYGAAQDLIGHNVTMLMPDSEARHHDAHVAAHIGGKGAQAIGQGRILCGRRRDGSTFPLDLTISELEENGERIFIGILRDATRRRAAEEALALSLARFRDYANAASDWFWEIDREMRFTYLSGRLQDVTGIDPAGLIGKTRLEIADTDPADPVWRAHLDDLTRHRPFRNFTYVLRHADGRRSHLRVSGRPIFEADGTFQGYRGVGSDITAAVETERALMESERRFRDLIEGSIQGVVIHRDFQPLFANSAYVRMMGFASTGDVLAQPSLLPCIAPENQAQARAMYRQLLAGESAGNVTRIRMLRHDGTEIWVDLIGRAVDWQGKPAMQVTLMDVSERVRYEHDLEQQTMKLMALAQELNATHQEAEASRQKAEAANRAKSQFLAMMSHELRTPMTGVLGIVDLLLASALSDEQAEFVATLKRSAESLLQLLNDILDFSKIEAGQFQFESIDFCPAAIVDDVMRLFTPRAVEKGLRIGVCLPDPLPAPVKGDPTRTRQILSNLIGNAIKFTAIGTIAVRLTSHRAEDGGTILHVEVEDGGIGISLEHQARLFQAFSQADASTTRRFGGTGLGLAICKRLVEGMGGAIGVRSAPGQGSTFWFTIHVQPGENADLARQTPGIGLPAIPAPNGDGLNVLLAEDNTINRMVITTMLNRLGHRVQGVENGRLAVESAVRTDYDVIILDMQMPEMDGQEACRHIRRLPTPRNRVPIIGLTADALPEHRAGYLEAGLTDFLTKPVDWVQLDTTIRRHSHAAGPGGPDSGTVAGAIPSQPPLLEQQRLAGLRLAIGDDVFSHTLTVLPGETHKCLALMDRAIADEDLVEAHRAAHKLRGLLSTYGACRVEVITRHIEEQTVGVGEVVALRGELETTVAETLAALAAEGAVALDDTA